MRWWAYILLFAAALAFAAFMVSLTPGSDVIVESELNVVWGTVLTAAVLSWLGLLGCVLAVGMRALPGESTMSANIKPKTYEDVLCDLFGLELLLGLVLALAHAEAVLNVLLPLVAIGNVILLIGLGVFVPTQSDTKAEY